MRSAFQWRNGRGEKATNSDKPLTSVDNLSFCLASYDPCGAFGGGSAVPKVSDHVESDETENTTLSSTSPIKDSPQSSDSKPNKCVEPSDAVSLSSTSQNRETFENDVDMNVEVAPSSCDNLRHVIEDATLCLLDGVCCRRTCDENEGTLETCGSVRRELRRRKSERAYKQIKFCCTTISWGPDDEEEISLLQDPIIEENEYSGGLNRHGNTPAEALFMLNTNLVNEQNLATPKHRNFCRRTKPIKECAYCGVTNAEAIRRMKICSRCKSAYYCSKECQSEDWYNRHKMTCIPVQYQ
ncbi:hypothetical protein HJC23_007468 [Cyclotella cryptica]|uniref:MYND-type domain-containing protein n=1 Tax=Cyclotella cryptica TaxID=29204 RepID=A0ABD3NSZ9_9STRA|eukprot:CCRYP_020098-RA/>CCRYP_020098-RA protein AED:0.16 eAED:0.16 QI:0/-1/0/1/-1/1/1/0/296